MTGVTQSTQLAYQLVQRLIESPAASIRHSDRAPDLGRAWIRITRHIENKTYAHAKMLHYREGSDAVLIFKWERESITNDLSMIKDFVKYNQIFISGY